MTCYPKVDSIIFREATSPPDHDADPPITPGVDDNEIALYYKSDGKWYVRLKNGIEQEFVAGGGGSVDWDDITNKPSVYPPDSHYHYWWHLIDDGSWQSVSFINGWRNYSSARDSARYIRRQNVLMVRGLVEGGAAGSNIFRLPSGYRPSITQLIATVSAHAVVTLYVEDDGYVHTNSGAGSWVSLHAYCYLD